MERAYKLDGMDTADGWKRALGVPRLNEKKPGRGMPCRAVDRGA